MLAGFGLADREPGLRARHRQDWGPPGLLTFEGFSAAFPTFPILLEAHDVRGVGGRLRPAALFRSFARTFLLDCYLESDARRRDEAGGRPVGIVIPFDGFRGGMCVHNADLDTRGTRMVHDLPGDVPPHRVTVEPFPRLVKHLARVGWAPGAPPAGAVPARRPGVRRGFRVYPWMNRVLGGGPEAMVLAFLWAVLHTRSGYYLHFVRVAGDTRLVAIDQAGLARQTGLGPRQVKHALAGLREAGFIASARRVHEGRMKGHILVDRAALVAALRTADAAGGAGP